MKIFNSKFKLLLFDIDGTLIRTGSAGSRAMDNAFEKKFALKNAFQGMEMAGFTDPNIIKRAFEAHGIDHSDGHYHGFLTDYLEQLEIEMQRSSTKRVLPGILEILQIISARKIPRLGLLTGNIEAGARIKLNVLKIADFFELGAYGSDRDDRNALLDVALTRYREKYGEAISPGEVMVIGDTPRDIACAKPFGAVSFSVATGPCSVKELEKHEPHHLFADLSDTEMFLETVYSNLSI